MADQQVLTTATVSQDNSNCNVRSVSSRWSMRMGNQANSVKIFDILPSPKGTGILVHGSQRITCSL